MVDGESIRLVCGRIVSLFDPDKVILFGSYAYGDPTPDSDVDLLLVMPLEGRAYRKAIEVAKAVQAPFPFDVVVRDTRDIQRRYDERDPLIREAVDKGVVMYERGVGRVGPEGISRPANCP